MRKVLYVLGGGFMVLSTMNLSAQQPCEAIVQKIRTEFPWITISLDQNVTPGDSEENCTPELQSHLDSLYTVMLNTPDLTEGQKKYINQNIDRINKTYGTTLELSELDWKKIKFYEGGDIDSFLEQMEAYGIQYQKNRHTVDSINTVRREFYDNVIWPQLRDAKNDDERRAIAAKYPDQVKFIESCGNGKRIE
ncbi:MAG: hypothetical protein KI786_00500 [Mameliella sp.]|nr:hypothetical protein [Phaeodactylibacter sp.]